MKINLTDVDKENFLVREGEINGVKCVLVNPNHIGTKWSRDTLVYRSSIWSEDGELLSGGFRKFFNASEKPDLYSDPLKFTDWNIVSKQDGSLLVIDNIGGKLNVRTRGVFNYKVHDSAGDIDFLINKYPKLFDNSWLDDGYSILCEYFSPNNRIVLNYGEEPTLWLLNLVDKDDYSYATQITTDNIARILDVPRPETFSFNSWEDIVESLENKTNFEGYVVYFNGDSEMVKLKTQSYLACHRFKEQATIDNLLDLFITWNYPSYEAFAARIEQSFDFECLKQCEADLKKICAAHAEAQTILGGMKDFVAAHKGLTRKEFAYKVNEVYGDLKVKSFLFTLLDGRVVDEKGILKLLKHCLEMRD